MFVVSYGVGYCGGGDQEGRERGRGGRRGRGEGRRGRGGVVGEVGGGKERLGGTNLAELLQKIKNRNFSDSDSQKCY